MVDKNEWGPIKAFSVDTSTLSPNEKVVAQKLIECARLIAPIYRLQENRAYPGANFYPHDATHDELDLAAKQNPKILDPYTIVTRNDTGKLVAVPYHIQYEDLLRPVAEKLREAASLTDNTNFKTCLSQQADALLTGKYANIDIAWLSMPQNRLSLLIGPLERFDDQLFFRKNSYTAVVGLLDESATSRAKAFKEIIHASSRKSFTPSTKAEFLDKVSIRVDNTLFFSGLDAKAAFTEADSPNDPELMERFGVEIILFKTSLIDKYDNELYPLAKQIFDPDFFSQYDTKELLFQSALDNMVIHGITNCLIRYKDAEDRLKELFPIISKLASYTLGIKNCRPLLLEDIISQQHIEAMILIFLTKAFAWWIDYSRQKTVYYHTIANAIILNYLLERSAINIKNGISWPNFMKTFGSLEELSEIANRILAFGSYEEAQNIIDAFGSFDAFAALQPALQEVEKI